MTVEVKGTKSVGKSYATGGTKSGAEEKRRQRSGGVKWEGEDRNSARGKNEKKTYEPRFQKQSGWGQENGPAPRLGSEIRKKRGGGKSGLLGLFISAATSPRTAIWGCVWGRKGRGKRQKRVGKGRKLARGGCVCPRYAKGGRKSKEAKKKKKPTRTLGIIFVGGDEGREAGPRERFAAEPGQP